MSTPISRVYIFGQQEYPAQDAQKGRSARPQRVKTGDVAFLTAHPKLPGQVLLRVRYVEDLNDVRTTPGKGCVLARQGWVGENRDFFSILLKVQIEELIVFSREVQA
jgi:hypothetical protein